MTTELIRTIATAVTVGGALVVVVIAGIALHLVCDIDRPGRKGVRR